jgi:S-adenosylmethionine uptake transporter
MKLKAILWMVFASFSLSVMSILIALIGDKVHFFQLMFLTTFVGLVIGLIFKNYSFPTEIKTTQVKYYIYRGALSTIAMFMWFYTLSIMDVAEATAISYLTPFLNFVAAIVLLKEVIKPRYILSLIFGLVGALFILRPSTQMGFGPLMALLTALFWCITDIITKARAKYDNAATQVFYSYLFMALFSLPFALNIWHPIAKLDILLIVILGIVQLINLYAICQAYHYADLVVILPFDFTRLIFTGIMSFIIFGEILSVWSIVGSIIILTSMIYMYNKETKLAKDA